MVWLGFMHVMICFKVPFAPHKVFKSDFFVSNILGIFHERNIGQAKWLDKVLTHDTISHLVQLTRLSVDNRSLKKMLCAQIFTPFTRCLWY